MHFYFYISMALLIYFFWQLYSFDRQRSVSCLKINGRHFRNFKILQLNSFLNRRVGLLNHQYLPEGFGVLIKSSAGIHTRGMLISVDLVFIDHRNKVDEILTNVGPNQHIRKPFWKRGHVLELASSAAIDELDLKIGDYLEFSN